MPELTTPTAPDSGAQPSPAVADTQTAQTPVDSGTIQPEGSSLEAKATTTPEPAARPEIKVPESKLKELQHMASALPGLQKKNTNLLSEIEQLKSKLAEMETTPKQTAQPKTEGNNATDYFGENAYKHPSVKQLPKDEDSGYVQYKGSWLHPETVIAMEDGTKNTQSYISSLESKITNLAEKLEAREKAESEVEYQSRVRKAEDGITNSIKSTVDDMLPGIFPNLPDAQKARFNKRAINAAQDNLADLIEEAKQNGELSADSISDFASKAITQAFDDLYPDYEVYDKLKQLESNQDYKQQNPVKPGGTPGTPGRLTLNDLTPTDRRKQTRDWAKRSMEQQSR